MTLRAVVTASRMPKDQRDVVPLTILVSERAERSSLTRLVVRALGFTGDDYPWRS